MSIEDQADGLYFTEGTSSTKSVLHKDVREVKDGIEKLSKQLDAFEIPTTVSIEVQIDLDLGKKISARTTRMLAPNETPQEGHERLYRECLESLAILIG